MTDTSASSGTGSGPARAAPFRTSPLGHRSTISAGHPLSLRELPHRALVIVRGDGDVIGTGVTTATGLFLPREVGGVSALDDRVAYWLSPDEWMLGGAAGSEAALVAELTQALAGIHAQVVNVTDNYTTIEVEGSRARDALARLTAIDLHPRAFTPGTCVSTTFAKGQALLNLVGQSPEPDAVGNVIDTFHLIVRASMADYLWCMIADAGRSFGMQAQTPRGTHVKYHLPHFE